MLAAAPLAIASLSGCSLLEAAGTVASMAGGDGAPGSGETEGEAARATDAGGTAKQADAGKSDAVNSEAGKAEAEKRDYVLTVDGAETYFDAQRYEGVASSGTKDYLLVRITAENTSDGDQYTSSIRGGVKAYQDGEMLTPAYDGYWNAGLTDKDVASGVTFQPGYSKPVYLWYELKSRTSPVELKSERAEFSYIVNLA